MEALAIVSSPRTTPLIFIRNASEHSVTLASSSRVLVFNATDPEIRLRLIPDAHVCLPTLRPMESDEGFSVSWLTVTSSEHGQGLFVFVDASDGIKAVQCQPQSSYTLLHERETRLDGYPGFTHLSVFVLVDIHRTDTRTLPLAREVLEWTQTGTEWSPLSSPASSARSSNAST
jgi:hypothetical protein